MMINKHVHQKIFKTKMNNGLHLYSHQNEKKIPKKIVPLFNQIEFS